MNAAAQMSSDDARGQGSGEFDLDAAVAAHPLPPGVDDADINLDELAAAMGVSVNTTSKWARLEGMPVIQEGRHGKAYVVRFSQAWAWREWSKITAAEARTAANRLVGQMQATLFNLNDGQATLTHKDRREISLADLDYSKAAQLRRQLVPLSEIVDMLGDIMKIIREGVETLPDRLERELGLEPDQVKRVIQAGRDTLDEMATRIEDAQLRERELGEAEFDDRLRI